MIGHVLRASFGSAKARTSKYRMQLTSFMSSRISNDILNPLATPSPSQACTISSTNPSLIGAQCSLSVAPRNLARLATSSTPRSSCCVRKAGSSVSMTCSREAVAAGASVAEEGAGRRERRMGWSSWMRGGMREGRRAASEDERPRQRQGRRAPAE